MDRTPESPRCPLTALAFLAIVPAAAHAQDTADDTAPPDPPRGLRVREPAAVDGYTLIAPLQSDRVYLVGLDGEVAHEWKTDYAPGGGYYLLDDGNLLRCGRQDDNPRFHGGGIGGRIQEYAWGGEVVWDYEMAGADLTQHHDVEPLPNGNVLVIAWEHRTPEQEAAVGRDAVAIGEDGLWPDAILEVRPVRPSGGEIVWEWHAWDHLIQDRDPSKPGYGSIPDHPELIDINADHRDQPPLTTAERERLAAMERRMKALGYVGGEDDEEDEEEGDAEEESRHQRPDWLHTNAVAYHPGYDLVALSVPRLNEIWVIDHSTTSVEAAGHEGGRWGRGGDLLYRWGNPRTYGAGGTADQRLFFQHDPTWVDGEGGELRMLVFNNGAGGDEDFSAVDELVLPFDPEGGFRRATGEAYGPAEPAWRYSDPGHFSSAFISGAQRLPGGNTLVCSGAPGRVFEVTRDGDIVWDYLNPFGGERPPTDQSGRAPKKALFRATRIPRDHPGLRGRF